MMRKIFCLLLIFAFLVTPVFGLSDEAIGTNNSLSKAEFKIKELKEANLSTERVSDIYLKSKQLYEAQVALEKAGGKPDYSLAKEKIKKIEDLKEKAFLLADELKALKLRIKESDVNTTKAEIIYSEALKEFEDERYEKAKKLIEKTYTKLSELESTAARIGAFYEAISKTFENFIRENFKKIISVILIISVTLIVLRNRIKIYRLKKKLRLLELRKEILKKLIKRTQSDYFEKGRLGENSYTVRTDKFGELIRDINRQIPLVKANIAKVEKPEKRREEKKENLIKRGIQKMDEKKKKQSERQRIKEKERGKKTKEKVEKLEDRDLEKITKDLLEIQKKPRNPVKRIFYEIDVYRRRKRLKRKLKS